MIKLVVSNLGKHILLYSLMGILFFVLSFYLVIGLNVLTSIHGSLVLAVAENMSGDVIIVPRSVTRIDLLTKDGEQKNPFLEDWATLTEFLDTQPAVRAASPRLRVWGSLKTDQNQMPVILMGVIPGREEALLPGRTMDEGTWLSGPRQINLYFRHSDYLSASLGDPIGISTVTTDGYTNFDIAELGGIVNYRDIDAYTDYALFGFVDLAYLRELRQETQDSISEVFVRLDSPSSLPALVAALEQRFPGRYGTVLPEDSSRLVYGVSNLSRLFVLLVAGILLIMVVICSGFLINIGIETRRKEIGIYQSIGVANHRIGGLLGGELLLIVILFGALGVAAGNTFLSTVLADGLQATILPLKLIFGRNTVSVTGSLVTDASVLTVLLSTFLGNLLFSLWKLEKLNPIDVLRED